MAIKIEVTRPEDLLRLKIEGDNLQLDAGDPEAPALTVEDPRRPAFLSVHFPPQSIAETAFFEASLVSPESNKPDPDAGKITEPLPGAGNVRARISQPSRLVFKVPPGSRIPFTTAGILDWSALELSVSPIAAIPAVPTPAQIAGAPSITRPGPTETALELPYRLIVSPDSAVKWAHRIEPFTSRGRTELWHTRLQLSTPQGPIELSQSRPAGLRAIWSDDYNPIHPPAPTLPDPDLGRTAMSPNDRHQIVILTSAFHGYEVDRKLLIGASPALERGTFRFRTVPLNRTVPYVPDPFFADQLILSPLGGWLRSRGQWDPPRRVRRLSLFEFPRFSELPLHVDVRPAPGALQPPLRADLFRVLPPDALSVFLPPVPEQEQLDLSEWVHVATQGRDHYVRIVYEGELWPFRNRAALIKVTERKFAEQNGLVVAYLFQRMFIVVREPEKVFGAADRGMPFKKVRLTTRVTPDIADPVVIAGTKRSFWVEVVTGTPPSSRFKFHAVGTDVAGNDIDFTVPMMFVSISEDAARRKVGAREYNASSNAGQLAARSAVVPGQKLVFAERDPAAATDNTQLVTRSVNFVMDSGGNAPRMLKADVNIPQVQELLGSDAPSAIRYFADYVAGGLDAATGVFAEVVQEDFTKFLPDDPFAGLAAATLGVNFSSDQAGGFATPNLGVSTLSRRLGPLAGKAGDAIIDKFDPSTFFKEGAAYLFGTFDLVKLLPLGTMGTNAPKLRTSTQDIAGGKLLLATLDWEPAVENVDLGVAALEKDYQGIPSHLLIHGRIEKPVKFDSLGAPVAEGVKFEFTGKLNDFRVSVLKAVYVNFKEFGFETRSNAKPGVAVKLDPAKRRSPWECSL
jgi:hypothetical protein